MGKIIIVKGSQQEDCYHLPVKYIQHILATNQNSTCPNLCFMKIYCDIEFLHIVSKLASSSVVTYFTVFGSCFWILGFPLTYCHSAPVFVFCFMLWWCACLILAVGGRCHQSRAWHCFQSGPLLFHISCPPSLCGGTIISAFSSWWIIWIILIVCIYMHRYGKCFA